MEDGGGKRGQTEEDTHSSDSVSYLFYHLLYFPVLKCKKQWAIIREWQHTYQATDL